jgi:prolyl-tRNA editing enzyme YbaK/EbsC (Cys-tRNA(Pro) deacylase)
MGSRRSGAVPPFGHDSALRVFVDPDVTGYHVVWAAAETWHDVFWLTPQQLVDASGGLVVESARI